MFLIILFLLLLFTFSTIPMPRSLLNSIITTRNPIVRIITITPHRMAERPNRTNVPNAPNHLPIHRTSPNTPAYTWALNPIAAKYVSVNSLNSHICNSTFAPIRVINPINAVTPVVRRLSRSSPISSPTQGAIKRINPISVIRATSVSPMR